MTDTEKATNFIFQAINEDLESAKHELINIVNQLKQGVINGA